MPLTTAIREVSDVPVIIFVIQIKIAIGKNKSSKNKNFGKATFRFAENKIKSAINRKESLKREIIEPTT